MAKKDFQSKIKQVEDTKRMTLAEWRASHRHEETLPSGLKVILRDVDMTDLLLTGLLPTAVLQKAKEAVKQESTIDLQEIGLELLEKDGPAFKKLLDAIAKAALLEPLIGEMQDEQHITIDELNSDDKNFIMEFVNREVEQIKSFRGKQSQPMAGVQHGDFLPQEAE